MRTHFPGFPALYDPPVDVVRQLRDVDPAADLLYMGWGTWYLVRFKPNRLNVGKAERALSGRTKTATSAGSPGVIGLLDQWRHNQAWRANPGAFRRLYGRYLFWTAVRLGARPIADYDRRFIRAHGFDAIVTDFRYMEWMYRHTSDAEVERLLNKEKDDAIAEARAEMADEYKATSMYEELVRNPHSVTAAAPRLGRSGFTETMRIA